MSTKNKPHKSLGKHIRGKGKPLVPKWKLFRANEPLLSIFMWGVNHSVTGLSHVPPPGLLMPDDFKAYSKIKVDYHGFNKDNLPSHFKVKEYCPNVFRNLREQFGIDDNEYLKSLTNYQPEVELSEPAKSTSRFYMSFDKKFVIKLIDTEAIAEIHSMLCPYHMYVVEKHGKTLLPQYLGLYRLTIDGNETYLLVMRNIFGRKYTVHKKFDLKGSTVQRQASEKEKSKELPTFKDNDFLDENYKLSLPMESRKKLIEMLNDDTTLLSDLHLMDYSLIVGIHDCGRAQEEVHELGGTGDSSGPDVCSGDEFQPSTPPDSPIPSTGAFAPHSSEDGLELDDEFYAISSDPESGRREIYFIGLVDILTYYGVKKRTASAAKSVKYGSEADNISTVKPEQYGRRLVEFIGRAVSMNCA